MAWEDNGYSKIWSIVWILATIDATYEYHTNDGLGMLGLAYVLLTVGIFTISYVPYLIAYVGLLQLLRAYRESRWIRFGISIIFTAVFLIYGLLFYQPQTIPWLIPAWAVVIWVAALYPPWTIKLIAGKPTG